MIINRNTKEIKTRSDRPDTNWLGEDWIVIEDGSELYNLVIKNYPYIDIVEGEIIVKEEEKSEAIARELLLKEIADIKEQLNATDYKIIKASEYNLAGLECEYDIQELHIQRQALRDRINELEESI